jgi:glucose/mannose transport system substrate-binding protein
LRTEAARYSRAISMLGETVVRIRRTALAVVGIVSLLAASACGHEAPKQADVEVFTWWSAGGEKVGLDALVGRFDADCPGQRFVNGTIAGGAGTDAKQVLVARLQQNDPPDTFQAHAGAELADYTNAGQIEDLSADYGRWGLKQAFPKGLIDNLTVAGRIYSVPANIHRANVVWSNTKVLANAGINTDPENLTDLLNDLARLRAGGLASPLAVGKDWTQLMLFESVLITDLGADKFTGLWDGGTDWTDAAVTTAIEDYKLLLTYANPDRDRLDWTDAEQLVVTGQAGYQLMGDWEAADLEAKPGAYGHFTFPGNGDTFQWLADSFVLPKGAKNPDGTKCWLRTVGSADGQKAFNTGKGSIPARIDASPADYPPYQRAAMADWKAARQVPSCAHGSACSQGWQEAVNAAIGAFSITKDTDGLQRALAAAAAQFAKN